MKLDKLDYAVIIIVAICLAAVGVAAFVSDPARAPSRVAWLYPASGGTQNVWMADVDNPATRQQLTFSEQGVFDFDFSPDGRWLAFADRTDSGAVTLRLLDLRSGKSRDLVDCVAVPAQCTSPAFSFDGRLLAYQRAESIGARFGLPRIWLVDMLSKDYDTFQMVSENEVVGHSAEWSLDSNTISFYSADATQPGILVYDLLPRGDDEAQLRFITSSHGTMGALSPNGRQIIFPELIRRGDQFFTHLQIADLAEKTLDAFSDPQAPIDDVGARWNPDGERVALARRYTDGRWTAGRQVYLRRLSALDQEPTPIVYDERYNTSYFRWNKAGDALVMQRLRLRDEDGGSNPQARPEVWAHDLESGQSRMIAEDAYLPQWVAS